MKHLHEYFEYDSYEALQDAIKRKDPSVKSMTDFLKQISQSYIKKDVKGIELNECKEVFSFVKSQQLFPKEGETIVLAVDCRLAPLHAYSINDSHTDSDILKGMDNGREDGYFLITSKEGQERATHIANTIQALRINLYEKITFTGTHLQSQSDRKMSETVSMATPRSVNERYDDSIDNPMVMDYLQRIANENLLGKRSSQVETVKKLLHKGYSRLKHEVIGVMSCSGKTIHDIQIIGVGSHDKTVVSLHKINRILSQPETDGIILFHNHPSGKTNPSRSDFETTKQIEKLTKMHGKKLMEHYVIGRNMVHGMMKDKSYER